MTDTLSWTQRATIAVEWALHPFSEVADPSDVCWINADNSGEDYCRDCAERRLLTLRSQNSDLEAHITSELGSYEHDGCMHCDTCGRLLRYCLLEEGLLEEMSHFSAYPPKSPIAPDDAFHIHAVVEAAVYSQAELATRREALWLGVRALRMLKVQHGGDTP